MPKQRTNPSRNVLGGVIKSLFWVILFFVGNGVLLDSVKASPTEYTAKGVVSVSGTDDRFPNRAFMFEVFVREDKWLIRAEPFDFLTNKVGAIFRSFQAGTDGSNVYNIAVFNEEYDMRGGQKEFLTKLKEIESQLSEKGDNPKALLNIRQQIELVTKQFSKQSSNDNAEKKPRNQAIGEVYPGVVPFFSESDPRPIVPIWLALCSGKVIKGTNVALGLFHKSRQRYAPDSEFYVMIDLTNSAFAPQLPQYVAFGREAFRLKDKHRAVSSGFKPQDLDAVYEASEFHSFGGLFIPSVFQLTKYKNGPTSTERVEKYSIDGKISLITNRVELVDFLPRVPEIVAVDDYRHGSGQLPSVRAFTLPNEWPSVQEVRASPDYLRYGNRRVEPKVSQSHYRSFILIVFGAVSILFLFLFWKMQTNTKPNT